MRGSGKHGPRFQLHYGLRHAATSRIADSATRRAAGPRNEPVRRVAPCTRPTGRVIRRAAGPSGLRRPGHYGDHTWTALRVRRLRTTPRVGPLGRASHQATGPCSA